MKFALLLALSSSPLFANNRSAAQGQRMRALPAPAQALAGPAAMKTADAPAMHAIPGMGILLINGGSAANGPSAAKVESGKATEGRTSKGGAAGNPTTDSNDRTAGAELGALTQRLPPPSAIGNELDRSAPLLRTYFDGETRRDDLIGMIGGVLAEELENKSSLGPSEPDPQPRAKDEPPAPKPAAWRSWPANTATFLNLFSGIGALLAVSGGAFGVAAALIGAAAVFDLLDGRLARALKADGPLGVQLDSLADVVSFGVAPALLACAAGLSTLGPVGFVPAFLFAAAGAFRLARFNVGAASPAPAGNFFTGMPIPLGAGLLISAVLALPFLPAALAAPALAGAATLGALMMASRIPYPSFKKHGLVPAALVALAVAGATAWLAAPLLAPAAVAGLYLLTGPAMWIYNGGSEQFRAELKRKRFHILAILLAIPGFLLLGYPLGLGVMSLVMGALAVVEYQRIKSPSSWPWRALAPWFGGLVRVTEAERPSGSFYAGLGLLAALALYGSTPTLFFAGVLALALGDSASPLVGLRFGWRPFKIRGAQRSLDGVLAGYAVALAIGLGLGFSPPVALLAAAAFSLVDTGVVPVKPDDNFWIPVVFPGALLLLSRLLG